MRLIQATVAASAVEEVRRALDAEDVDYFATDETESEKYAKIFYISIDDQLVEDVLERLYASGVDSADHVVIIDTEVDIFGRADGEAVDGAATDGDGGGGGGGSHARIASAELEGKVDDLLPDLRTFVTMMVLSTIVATTGVLLNSSAVVVGSMVLAPLFGPAVSASVGTVIDRPTLFWRGLRFQVVGIAVAIVSAIAFAWVMKTAYLIPSGFSLTAAPQIAARLSPDLLSLVVALVAGIAGVISIATDAGRALVGVMMAAALLPPAAIVGIGLVWAEPAVAVHSGILLFVNLLAVNFAGLVTLWYLGYRPQSWIQIPQTRRALVKRGGTLLIAMVVTSAFLWNVTYANAQQTQLQNSLESELGKILNSPEYTNVTLLNVKVVQEEPTLMPETERVIVTIGRPPGERHPTLRRQIDANITEQVGHDVRTSIRVSLLLDETTEAPTHPDREGDVPARPAGAAAVPREPGRTTD